MNTKQVIVIRKDLKMRKGKMIAQGAHASMKIFFDRIAIQYGTNGEIMLNGITPEMDAWINGLFTKICVGVNGEAELMNVYEHAQEKGIPCSLIQDAGLTEFDGVPTYTAVAVGPDRSETIDEVTGHLNLL